MERRQDGQQHIGIVLDLVQIVVVFVVVVGGLVGIQILPQFVLLRAIVGLCRQQVGVLGEIGGRQDVGRPAAEYGRTGGYAAQQESKHEDQPQGDQAAFPMSLDKGCRPLRFFRGFLRRICRGLRRFPCTFHGLAGLYSRPVCRRILPLQALFLPQTGNGVGGSKLGIVKERLLV